MPLLNIVYSTSLACGGGAEPGEVYRGGIQQLSLSCDILGIQLVDPGGDRALLTLVLLVYIWSPEACEL